LRDAQLEGGLKGGFDASAHALDAGGEHDAASGLAPMDRGFHRDNLTEVLGESVAGQGMEFTIAQSDVQVGDGIVRRGGGLRSEDRSKVWDRMGWSGWGGGQGFWRGQWEGDGALFGREDGVLQLLELANRIVEPGRGPDPVNLPAKTLKDTLAKTVAVSGGAGGVVAGAIAFDPEEISAWVAGIDDREVEEEPGATDLGMDEVPRGGELAADLELELGIGFAVGGGRGFEGAGFGVLKKGAEGRDAGG